MNYEGSEEVRHSIKELSEATYELFTKYQAFEKRYKWNKGQLTERLAGAAVGNLRDEVAKLYRQMAEIDYQFQD